jgi:hypothetical protein
MWRSSDRLYDYNMSPFSLWQAASERARIFKAGIADLS